MKSSYDNHIAPELFLGVDIGTQGVRAFVADATGTLVAHASKPLRLDAVPSLAPGWFEQHPQHWWEAMVACLHQITTTLGERCAGLHALAITATSGTVCVLDAQGRSIRPAIMYSDQRATEETALLNDAATTVNFQPGYRFSASFGLPKLLWLQRHEPATVARCHTFAHAGDVLVAQLTGTTGVSDWSQALKSGYDLCAERWPSDLLAAVGLPDTLFPRVVPPGTPIGDVTPHAAEATGLPAGLTVVAGLTDGCAAQVAGGAVEPGQWLSVLGTTLVLKGVTTDLLHDPHGRIYSHRHPQGLWLPGAASNTGGEVLARHFPNTDLAALDRQAANLTPSGIVCYPLQRIGERFPFDCPTAEGFVLGTASSNEQFYTACLEGVGYCERLAYETLDSMGAQIAGPVRATGGGARSVEWLRIRATILKRVLLVPQHPDAAMGAAALAASASAYPDLAAATRAMVRVQHEIEPLPEPATAPYDQLYEQFVTACRERGYLDTPGTPAGGTQA